MNQIGAKPEEDTLKYKPVTRQQTDFTVFEKLDASAFRGELARLFERAVLAKRSRTSKKEFGGESPIYSIEESVILEGNPNLRARAAICRCFEGKYLSATFRIVDKPPKCWSPTSEPTAIRLDTSTFCNQGAAGGFKEGSIERLLYDRIWPGKDDIEQGGELRGLILLFGATKSGKNYQAQALIHQYLADRRFQRHWIATRERRAHLVTYEVPIEKYLCEDPAQLQAINGIDYTPRQYGKDADGLDEVLSNALRQTPAVLFVAETRTEDELRRLVEFAGSGHLVITTAHAHSLSEGVGKLFSACKASTASARREVADKLCAVVHLTPRALKSDPQKLVRLPTVFRANSRGKQTLMAEGRACLLPYCGSRDEGYCWGRNWFVKEMQTLDDSDRQDLSHWASTQDLLGL